MKVVETEQEQEMKKIKSFRIQRMIQEKKKY
jgi:hypothetical protein